VHCIIIEYHDIKPWGRSFNEYVRMFSLAPTDLTRKIMGWEMDQQVSTQSLQSEVEISYLSILFTISALIRSDNGSVKHMMK
jgi:hypothetical protein